MGVVHRRVPSLPLFVVAGSEDVSLDREELVVDETAVGGEETHQENEVSESQNVLHSWV